MSCTARYVWCAVCLDIVWVVPFLCKVLEQRVLHEGKLTYDICQGEPIQHSPELRMKVSSNKSLEHEQFLDLVFSTSPHHNIDQEGPQSRRFAEGGDCLGHNYMEEPLRMRSWEAVAHIRQASVQEPMPYKMVVALQRNQDPMSYTVTALHSDHAVKLCHKAALHRDQAVRLAYEVALVLGWVREKAVRMCTVGVPVDLIVLNSPTQGGRAVENQ